MANLILRDDNDLEERYTPEEMNLRILQYFSSLIINRIDFEQFYDLDDEGREVWLDKHDGLAPNPPMKPTTSGLAMYLGFPDRRAMNGVQPDGQYALIIRRGISMIEEYMEQELYSAHCGGAKFWLKNHGWVESQPKDFGTDKVFNVMIDAEVVENDKEKEKKQLIELKENLKQAGLDIVETVDIEITE